MPHTFSHRHLLGIEQLSPADIEEILRLAEHYFTQGRSAQKKTPKLNGKTVVNLFFEASTRTRTSFEIAAKRLGADVVNVAIEHSSVKKGETLLDTTLNLDAMQIDALIMRHSENNALNLVASNVKSHVINAGDGTNEHPTQALLDALTMRRHKGKLQGLKVAICGDVAHSRVANSNIKLLGKFGAKVSLVAPSNFMLSASHYPGVERHEDLRAGIAGADVVMMLRIQHERLAAGEFAMSLHEYHQRFGLNHDVLKAAKPDVIVMHPGPVNRGVEITDKLADDTKHSVIHEQVETGVAVRMAVLDLLLSR